MSSVHIHDVRKSFGRPARKPGCLPDAGGEQVAVLRERDPFSPGDMVRLPPDPAFVHLFDETTGKRMNAWK